MSEKELIYEHVKCSVFYLAVLSVCRDQKTNHLQREGETCEHVEADWSGRDTNSRISLQSSTGLEMWSVMDCLRRTGKISTNGPSLYP